MITGFFNSLRTAKDLELSLLVKESHIQLLNLKLNDLENKINKAIEYIEKLVEDDENYIGQINKYRKKELLEILKGEDNEI